MELMNSATDIISTFQLPEGNTQAILIGTLIFAIITCFLGLKMYRVWLAVGGLLLGAVIGLVGASIYHVTSWAALGAALVCGAIAALIAYKLYKAGVFLFCWGAGTSLAAMLLASVIANELVSGGISLAVGLVFGIIGVIYSEPIIIIVTGLQGGFGIALAGGELLALSEKQGLLILLAGVVLSIVGIMVQFAIEGRRRGKLALEQAHSIKKEASVENEVEAARTMIIDLDNDDED
ncbi:MAG: TMEM198/TM7SF3 family protein [Lachnospiraceae bacterium]|nr:TMEM198/TM7SF3 family protein [Lachnospiraceae bacterium]